MTYEGNTSYIFQEAIKQSINEWTELLHVIEVYGAGGRQAGEKLIWMGDVLFDYFRTTPEEQLKNEINNYVAAIVDNEFDFVPMDKSMDIFVDKLLEYHLLWSTGKVNSVCGIMDDRKRLNRLKKEALAKENKTLTESMERMVLSNDQQPSAVQNTDPNLQATTSSSSSESNLTSQQSGNDVEMSDSNEWTVVNKRRNRKR